MAHPSIFCSQCNSSDIISRGKDWQCKDCNKFWRKNPKPKGWRVKNLGNFVKSKIKISSEEMKKLYEGKGQREVAKILGVTQSAVSLFMRQHGIEAKPKYIWKNRDPKKQKEINRKISKALKGNTNWRYSHVFPNGDELTLIRFFARNRLAFEYVGDGSFLVDGKCPDFVWKDRGLIVEFFGDIWHRSTDEPSRIKFFERRGWRCLVVWGREIRKSGWEETLLKKILQFINT